MSRRRICALMAIAVFATAVLTNCLLAADAPAVKSDAGQSPATAQLTAEERIRQALRRPIDLKYEETPLTDVAADLQKKLGVPVQLDRKALIDVGIECDTRLTFASSKVSAKATIALMLRQLNLATAIANEVLLITTPEEAENVQEVRVYEVSDLVRDGASRQERDIDFDSLIEITSSCVAPTTWPGHSGPGPISFLVARGIRAIVFPQMEDVHEEAELLLWNLRAARDARAIEHKGADAPGTRPPERNEPALLSTVRAEAAIRKKLAQTIEIHYNKLPLDKVADDLEAKLGVPVRLDVTALRGSGVSTIAPVTFTSAGVSAKAAIVLMLRELKLTAIAKYEVLLITTPEEAESTLETRVYEVGDLVRDSDGACDSQADFDSLIHLITASVHDASWDGLGGPGIIASYENSGLDALVIRQTEAIHEEVEALLAKIRAVRRTVSDTELRPSAHGKGPRKSSPSPARAKTPAATSPNQGGGMELF